MNEHTFDDIRDLMEIISDDASVNNEDHLLRFVENSLFLTAQAHHWHLQATNHTMHVELDELYKELPEYIDYFIENLMASRGPITPSGDNRYDFQSIDLCIPVLEQYLKHCNIIHSELSSEPACVNALEDVMSFINSTLMKIKYLP